MTTAFGDKMQAVGTAILARVGIAATATVTTSAPGVDANGSPVPAVTAAYPVTVSPLLNVADVLNDAQLQQLGPSRTRLVLLAAAGLAFTPKAGMSLTIGSESFTVGDVLSDNADERVALWSLVLEG